MIRLLQGAIVAHLLLLCCSDVQAKGVGGPQKGATVLLNTQTGAVTLTLKNGKEAFELLKAPPVKLGDRIPNDDPDMIRALSADGTEVVIIRLKDDPQNPGKRTFDGDGYASVGGHRYTLEQAGAVETAQTGVLSVLVDLKRVKKPKKKPGEVNTPDYAVASEEKLKRDKDRKKNKTTKAPTGKVDILAPPGKKVPKREKRSTAPLYIEVGFFVDQGFYDAYVTKYGSRDAALTKISSFLCAAVVVINSDYKSLERPITVLVKQIELWITQPSFTTEAKQGGNIYTYLEDFTESERGTPTSFGADHSMVFSGYQLQGNNVLGVAYLDVICKRYYAGSVMNTFDLAAGEIASHELAHSLGARHDGESMSPESNCAASDGFLMAPSINPQSTADKLFSSCSKQRFKNNIAALDAAGTNCLLDGPCADINHLNYCSYGTVYCPANYYITAANCQPASSFPEAASAGQCLYRDMCRKLCDNC